MVSTLRFVAYIVLVTFVVGAFGTTSKAQSISKQLAGESYLSISRNAANCAPAFRASFPG